MSKPLLIADVAARLGVSKSRVAALDTRLQPEKTPGGVRIYREDAIGAELARRAERSKR